MLSPNKLQTITKKTSESRNILIALSDGNVEIRAIQKTDLRVVIWSGIFDNYDSLAKSAREAENNGLDVYMGLNPSNMNVTNNIEPFRRTVKDKNITRIRRLLFDMDPIRETGTPALEFQINAAQSRTERLMGILHDWGEPMIGFSGNGYHLQYRCDLENCPDTAKILNGLYEGLKIRISTAEVDFDSTVRNPSRITRFYGTTNRKSGRRSECTIPDNWEITPSNIILETAKKLTPPKPMPNPARRGKEERRGRYIKNWDIVGRFTQAGMYISEGDGMHFVVCPWKHEHSSESPRETAIWAGEWPQFRCLHAHCDHRTILDVIGYFECN